MPELNTIQTDNTYKIKSKASNETIVTQASDLSGDLDGYYSVQNNISVDSIDIEATKSVFIEISPGIVLTFTGTGDLIGDGTSKAGQLSIMGGTIVLAGAGATLFNTNGFIVTAPNAAFICIAANIGMGQCINSPLSVDFERTLFSSFATGLFVDNLAFSFVLRTVLFSSTSFTGSAFSIGSGVPLAEMSGVQADLTAGNNIFDIDSSFVGSAKIAGVTNLTGPTLNFFDATGLDETSKFVTVTNSEPQADSTSSVEVNSFAMGTTTLIPAAGACVIMNGTGFVADEINRFTVDANGISTFTGLSPEPIKMDGNILLEPASSTKDLGCQFAGILPTQTTVTFTNGTNVINETSTPLINGNEVTFLDNGGTLPSELREDIVYFVVNQNTNDFQISYNSGGSAVTFTDNGTGTNQYKVADTHGAIPKLPIAANSPRNLVPQALKVLVTNEKVVVIIINFDDSVNIETTDAYYRLVK